jgi:hypothetical protein
MFQDEARFGRITDPRQCWAPMGCRPIVKKQIIREYTYAYAAVSPADGTCHTLILPVMNAEAMNCFLAEVAKRHADELILMIYDGAPCHSITALNLPSNILVLSLPPYSPELNPVEALWDHLRENFFPNLSFDSMDELEAQLVHALCCTEADPSTVLSIASYPWIVSSL